MPGKLKILRSSTGEDPSTSKLDGLDGQPYFNGKDLYIYNNNSTTVHKWRNPSYSNCNMADQTGSLNGSFTIMDYFPGESSTGNIREYLLTIVADMVPVYNVINMFPDLNYTNNIFTTYITGFTAGSIATSGIPYPRFFVYSYTNDSSLPITPTSTFLLDKNVLIHRYGISPD